MPASPSPTIAEDLVELIASGVDVYVATRDAQLEPESMLAMGVRAHSDRCSLTVYLPQALAEATCKNIRNNGEVAVTLIRPSDFKAVQLKGRAHDIRAANETERELQAIFRSALVEQLATVGVPRCATRRLVWWPSWAVDVTVRQVFVQTPGPAAGEPLKVS